MAEIHFIHGLCLIGAQQPVYGLNDTGSFPGRDREFLFATHLSSLNLGPPWLHSNGFKHYFTGQNIEIINVWDLMLPQ
jgi:hypothetical protein